MVAARGPGCLIDVCSIAPGFIISPRVAESDSAKKAPEVVDDDFPLAALLPGRGLSAATMRQQARTRTRARTMDRQKHRPTETRQKHNTHARTRTRARTMDRQKQSTYAHHTHEPFRPPSVYNGHRVICPVAVCSVRRVRCGCRRSAQACTRAGRAGGPARPWTESSESSGYCPTITMAVGGTGCILNRESSVFSFLIKPLGPDPHKISRGFRARCRVTPTAVCQSRLCSPVPLRP